MQPLDYLSSEKAINENWIPGIMKLSQHRAVVRDLCPVPRSWWHYHGAPIRMQHITTTDLRNRLHHAHRLQRGVASTSIKQSDKFAHTAPRSYSYETKTHFVWKKARATTGVRVKWIWHNTLSAPSICVRFFPCQWHCTVYIHLTIFLQILYAQFGTLNAKH